MLHPYRVEPLRPALILIGVVLLIALLMPNPAARILTLVLLSGPLAWGALQLTRKGRGVILSEDQIELQSGVLRRSTHIALSQIQCWEMIPDGQLSLAYLKPRKVDNPRDEPRPPRLKIYVTPALAEPESLNTLLPVATGITLAQLQSLVIWRRIRRFILLLFGLLFGVPTLVILSARLIGVLSNALGLR